MSAQVTETLVDPEWENGPDEIPDVPETDHFGNPVETYSPVSPDGAGEKCECTNCGASSQFIALFAATADLAASKWEEHYICECGATGTFRVSEQGHRVFHGDIQQDTSN